MRAVAFTALLLAGCAAASGYDPKRYARDADVPDPDTAPLPSTPRTTIPDPKQPPVDAGAADASTKKK